MPQEINSGNSMWSHLHHLLLIPGYTSYCDAHLLVRVHGLRQVMSQPCDEEVVKVKKQPINQRGVSVLIPWTHPLA